MGDAMGWIDGVRQDGAPDTDAATARGLRHPARVRLTVYDGHADEQASGDLTPDGARALVARIGHAIAEAEGSGR